MTFEPIAIVGQACVLPGAFSPTQLWTLVERNACSITQASPADFGLSAALAHNPPYASGFVRGFERTFDQSLFGGLGLDVTALGPPCTWPLHVAHMAWEDAGLKPISPDRIGVIIGNLGYPSQLKSAYATDIWQHGVSDQNPLTSLNANFATQLIARHIGATGPTIALDAACASSLYALEIACRKLQARQIDAALVGATNTADNLTLHVGFDALQALSPSRQSRPFHHEADGLVPSEGAAAIVLKRYADIDESDTVHGVIRAIGLSNDGNRKGLLAPSEEGQIEAITNAWQQANLPAQTIDFLECHATGTPTGDTTELHAANHCFAAKDSLPIGSLKANLGHLITVAGLASVLKVTQAMANETLPPMPHDGPQNSALSGSTLSIQTQASPWQASAHPRRAGISNFGFGGNNAHLIIDQYVPGRKLTPVATLPMRDEIVVTAAAPMRGQEHTTHGALRHLSDTSNSHQHPMTDISVDPMAARTPPTELSAAEPQHLALLNVVQAALSEAPVTHTHKTGVFTTNSVSFDFCRFLTRERAPQEIRDKICEPLAAKHVLGAMANMAANRINFADNIRGRGVSILSDASGDDDALDAALTALHAGQLSMAVVASAHLPDDIPSRIVKTVTQRPQERMGHSACLILMRKTDALAQNCNILGTLSELTARAPKYASPIFNIGATACLAHRNTSSNPTMPGHSVSRSISYPQPKFPQPDRQPMTTPMPHPTTSLPLAPARPHPQYPSTRTPPHAAHMPARVLSGHTPLIRRQPQGRQWASEDIARASTGPVSDLFGPLFKQQDAFARVVRLPDHPLLFVDQILGLDAEAGVESRGTIWTQTDLSAHHWIHHNNYIRPGPLIECGQADLTLISYMGADFRNKGDRVYRLLGCDITFHSAGMPYATGDLTFQIEIVGHATLGETRLFFFQYDAYKDDELVFSVRNGQAGFFTTEELTNANGMNWDASTIAPPTPDAGFAAPLTASTKTSFTAKDVTAFRAGDPYSCFGEGFERTAAHSRTPHIPAGKLALFDHVETFSPSGGPWQRGYLKAIAHMPQDHWLYDGHFHNDPCMPGTMMAEAAVQALEFHATALGLTIDRDGYIFEPLPHHNAQFICRGQVTPDEDHTLSYEVFIDKIIHGDTIEVHAALLASCDGRKVFLCPHFAIHLRRVWPKPDRLTSPEYIGPAKQSRGDQTALLACANGAPSEAFGDMYAPFDTLGNVPRLPAPPYHMMTRISDVSSVPGDRSIGARLVSHYKIEPDAWYFDCNDGVMPLSILTEIALQPCGWLASHCGFALDGGSAFRNLEGDGHIHRSIRPNDGTLTITSRLTTVSKVGPMTIVGFELSVSNASGNEVMSLDTQFGFFPPDALARQAGLTTTDTDAAAFNCSDNLSPRPAYQAPQQLGRLHMLDEINYFDPAGGSAKLGMIRARQKVDPYAWYFKAHFFQDPVQPGSLGLDALVQALRIAAQMKGILPNNPPPIIETPASGAPIHWSYRGQVTPSSEEVVSLVEITDITTANKRTMITARGSLWCDGIRIYEMATFAIAFNQT